MFYRRTSHLSTLIVVLTLSLLCVVAAFSARPSAAKLGMFGSSTVALQQPDIVPPYSVRRLSLPANDLIVDSNTQAIYASVPGTAGTIGNSLTRIDPVAGTIGASVFIGSDPNKLAISDNKQFIYAALDGEGAVRRFDIATQTAQLRFSLGNSGDNGPMLVGDIEVLPGAPQSVAISRRFPHLSPDHAGVVIYDNGVPRPTTTNVHVGMMTFIEFSSTAATLYGFNSGDTGLQTYRLSVTASGVSIAGQILGSFQEFGNIEFEGGRLYHTAGKVSDPEAGTIVGTYAGMNFLPLNNAPSVVVDSANNRVYFLAGGGADPGSSGQARIYAFDKTTFALVASFTVAGTVGRIGSLVQWNATGLAFRDDNAVYLIPTPVPGPPPAPTPTPTPVPTPTATPLPGEFRQIALATRDLVVEPNSQNIYASVPSSAGALGNRLALIDPVSGTIASSVAVGSEPNALAVSENGQYIYVGLDGDNAVRRFDVATQTAGPQFSTVAGPRDISAMPGNPNSIAIVRRASADEVLIYDNGVPRTITKLHDVTGIAFSNSPEVLYGANTESTSYEFSKMTVASCGVALTKGTRGIFPSADIKYDNGRVYATNGYVIDPEIPSLVGTFSTSDIGFPVVEPDSKANRIYSLRMTGSSATLYVFDMQTLVSLGALNLPGVTGLPDSLVRWGANGLAFNTPTQVFLLQNALIGGSSPVTPAPPPLPSTFTVKGNVMSFATLEPTSDVTITFTGSQSGVTQTDSLGNFSISNVPLCGTLTVTATKTNWTFTPASIVITDPSTQRANFSSFHRIIGFVQSSVTVSEGANRVFLAISRSAGLPPTTTDIPYSTSSGTASDHSDFTPVFGTFHFDVGIAQAPLEVLITNDVFVEGSETFTATLEPIPGFDLVNPTVTVTIADNDTTPPVTSPLQNAQFFVRRHYHDFLNRDPDTAGLNFWSAQITACNAEPDLQKRGDCFEERHVNVSAAFFFSIEFQATGYLVERLYAVSFPDSMSRPRGLPRFTEFLRDTQQIGRGVIVGQGNWQEQLEQNTQEFLRSWVDRAEFRAQNPESLTADQYVDALFARGGVVPSAVERAAAIAAFGSGGSEGRALALRNIAQSRSIYNQQYNPALVLMQYFGYLRRNPSDPPEPTLDFAGYDFWLNKLNEFSLPGEDVSNEAVALERVRRAQMVKSFLVSGEYMSRVGPDNFNIRQ